MARRENSTNMFSAGRTQQVAANKKSEILETKDTFINENPVELPEPEKKEYSKNNAKEQKKDNNKSSQSNNIDSLLKKTSKNHGVQRSIYFDSDVYDALEEYSKKYDIKLSNLVNTLLRNCIIEK